MSREELLLGFDGRVEGNSDTWDAKRREQFLLRTDVVQPFSTDTTVWPSAIDADLRPRTCIGHQTLWNDLEHLQSFSAPLVTEHSWLIAVTVKLANEPKEELDWWKLEVPIATPAELSEAWSLLGYDVSDRWLLSGLSNSGFLTGIDDVNSLRASWSRRLNEHHLFYAPEDAYEFRDLSNLRIAEHSPFFVFGIWTPFNLTRSRA
jgi:hypothetical protein